MGWEAWFVLAVVLGVLAVLVSDKASPALAMSGGMVAVLVTGIVTPSEALAGFSNPAPLTVAALFVLARAVEKTGALTPVVRATLGETKGLRSSLARLVIPTTAASAFLNNTPIVAMLLPQVRAWAEARGRSPSLYLMPLSFAALLGGVVTLIGTSTNLVISGLLIAAGEPQLGFFEMTIVGLPIAILGSLMLVMLTPVLLPERRKVLQETEEETRGFVVDMVVEPRGPLGGKTVESAGLRHLSGLFLATLERDQDLLAPVAPDTVLLDGDRLRFVGKADQILDLQHTRGLASAEKGHLLDFAGDRSRYFEAVIGSESPLVGKTMFEAGFRARYQAAVLAIHRAGQRIEGKLGQIRLRVGDTLLLAADRGFRDRWRDRNDFLLVSALRPTPSRPTKRALDRRPDHPRPGGFRFRRTPPDPQRQPSGGGWTGGPFHPDSRGSEGGRRPGRDRGYRLCVRGCCGRGGIGTGRDFGRGTGRCLFAVRRSRNLVWGGGGDCDPDGSREQQRRSAIDVPNRSRSSFRHQHPGEGIRGGGGSRGLSRFPDPDRVSNQHHGLRTGWIPVRRLRAAGCTAHGAGRWPRP